MSIGKFYDTDKARAAQARRFGSPADPQRQGRVAHEPISITAFEDGGGVINALLGVTIVGQITLDPNGGFIWSCFLPQTPRMQRASDLHKAKAALDFKIREWCEAACVVVSAAALKERVRP